MSNIYCFGHFKVKSSPETIQLLKNSWIGNEVAIVHFIRNHKAHLLDLDSIELIPSPKYITAIILPRSTPTQHVSIKTSVEPVATFKLHDEFELSVTTCAVISFHVTETVRIGLTYLPSNNSAYFKLHNYGIGPAIIWQKEPMINIEPRKYSSVEIYTLADQISKLPEAEFLRTLSQVIGYIDGFSEWPEPLASWSVYNRIEYILKEVKP